MFEKVIVFGLFEIIQKKKRKEKKRKSEDRIPGSGFGLRVKSDTTTRAVTMHPSTYSLNHIISALRSSSSW